MILEHLIGDLRSLLFPGSDASAIPTMDGPLTPNTRLDEAEAMGAPILDCDDLALDADRAVYVACSRRVLRVSSRSRVAREVVADYAGTVGAIALSGQRLYAGVSGEGLVVHERGEEVGRVDACDGEPLNCINAICRLPDGALVLAEGSTREPPARWNYDLMSRKPAGRLVHVSADLAKATTLARGLAWPYGLALSGDGAELWYTESWRHRLMALPVNALDRAPRAVIPDLPGYPARLSRAPNGTFWMAIFAVRTHLIEHVLRERRFREEMVATIDPELWVAPMLRSPGGYREPLQMGAIKKLGVMKPWAPPRSYGLVVQLSAEGEPLRSLHSRAAGRHHGITTVLAEPGRLLLAAKGDGELLDLRLESD